MASVLSRLPPRAGSCGAESREGPGSEGKKDAQQRRPVRFRVLRQLPSLDASRPASTRPAPPGPTSRRGENNNAPYPIGDSTLAGEAARLVAVTLAGAVPLETANGGQFGPNPYEAVTGSAKFPGYMVRSGGCVPSPPSG